MEFRCMSLMHCQRNDNNGKRDALAAIVKSGLVQKPNRADYQIIG